jgi:sugar phosphate isomerase/epimerase
VRQDIFRAATRAAHCVGRADDDRVSQSSGNLFRFLNGICGFAQRHLDPQAVHSFFKGNAIFTPFIGINLDTGNAFLCGHDPYAWLKRVAKRLVHLHAKDISVQQGGAERGKVTGTPVGCACGDGVIDWKKVIQIIRKDCPRDIVLSVECGTPDQAARSLAHLGSILSK